MLSNGGRARWRFLETGAPGSSCIGALFLGILGPAGLALALSPGPPSYSSGERGALSQLCRLPAGVNRMCVSPKLIRGSLTPQRGGVWKRGLRGVIGAG